MEGERYVKWVKWRETWLNLPISRKLSLVIGGIAGFLIFTTLVSTLLFFSMSRNNEQVLSKQEAWFSQQEIKHYIYARINSVLEYISTGEGQFLQKFYENCIAARSFEKYLLANTPPNQLGEIERFIQFSQDWEFILRNQVIPVYQLGNEADAWLTLVEEAEPMEKKLILEVTRFSTQKEAEILELSRRSKQQGESMIYFGVFITMIAILIAIVLFVVLKNSINKPIQKLHQGTRRLAKGDLYYRVAIEGNDEFGQLGDAFNLMGERVTRLINDAQSANRLKSEFLATISHELRTPLNGIIGFTEAIRERLAGPLTDKQQEYLSHIYDNAEHLLTLINEILDLSKIEAGKMGLQLQEIDVDSFFAKSLHVIQEQARSKQIELAYKNHSGIPMIMADPTRLTEIMNNLLSNAVKFTPTGGNVWVELNRTGDLLSISVLDTGIGIRQEGIDKLFLPFYQDEGAWDRQHEGTGLGLALTKKLVELHGGTITVHSELSKGTNITFTLQQSQPLSKQQKVLRNNKQLAPIISREEIVPVVWVVGTIGSKIKEWLQQMTANCRVKYVSLEKLEKSRNEQPPDLVLYFWDKGIVGEGEDLPSLEHEAIKRLHQLEIPIVLISNYPFSLHEMGLLYRFVKDIVDLDQAHMYEKITHWLEQIGGGVHDTGSHDSDR